MSNLEKAILFCVVGIGWIIISMIAVVKCNFLVVCITFGIALGHFAPVVFHILKILSEDWKEEIKNISPNKEAGFGLGLLFTAPFMSIISFLFFLLWTFVAMCFILHGTHRFKIIQQTNGDRR